MRRFLTGLVCAAVTVLLSGWVLAGPIAITNPGFETVGPGVLANSNPSFGSWGYVIPGWTGEATPPPVAAGVFRPIASISVPPEGLNVAFANGPTIGQVLTGTTLAPLTNYVLTVEVGQRFDQASSNYLVELLAGTTLLASASGGTSGPGTWLEASLIYSSPSTPPTGDLAIHLSKTGGFVAVHQVLFDEVALAAVPEPASFFLIGSGLFGLALVSRRLRRR
jgi:hypothetical protein